VAGFANPEGTTTMTDARPEPDQTEPSPEPGERPEPVWARPAQPDPWSAPVDARDDVETPASTASEAPAEASGEASGEVPGEPLTQPVPAGAPTAPQPPAAPQPTVLQPTAPQPTAPQYPQYQAPPQYAPQYPAAPQFPQYMAPQGFGSPQGPSPMEASGTAEAGPYPSPFPAPDGSSPASGGYPPAAGYPTANGSYQPPGGPYPASVGTYPPSGGQLLGGSQPGGGWPAQPLDAPDRGRTRGRGALFTLVIAASLLAGAIGGVAGSTLRDDVIDSSGRNPTISLPAPAPEDSNRPASAVTTVANAVLPSVVSIKVKTATEAGTGSGFVIDAQHGYILTNNHVVTAGGNTTATTIAVVFQDGQQVPGKVVGRDASYDLAVVKVQARGLRALVLGNSDQVRVGDPVVAIGAPLGLQGTVTTGIVSALNRPVAAGEGDQPAFINAIQTDAAINPGNSGGPLVDSTGKVIAINSAIAKAPDSLGSSSGNIGLGFAIPSNQAHRTAEELIRTGKAEHPIIGVSLDSTYEGPGVLVSKQPSAKGQPPVTPGGPADKAGIKAGDVITKFGSRPVTDPDELIVAIRAQRPGDTITLTVKSGNSRERQVRVKLSAASD
jgi:putative serine protease PepD